MSDGRLSYYINKGDGEARMTIRIDECQVTKKTENTIINDKLFYGLGVTHLPTNVQWALICESRDDRDEWVSKLQEARGSGVGERELERQSSYTRKDNGSDSSNPIDASNSDSNNVDNNMAGAGAGSSTANIPKQYLKPLETLIVDIQTAADAIEGWDDMFTKDLACGGKMHAYRRPGDAIIVKGSAIMPPNLSRV